MNVSLRFLLFLVLPGLLLGGGLWWITGPDFAAGMPVPTTTGSGRADSEPDRRSELLARTRRSCRIADLDAFVADQRKLVAGAPTSTNLRVLAEALYERMLARDLAKGFRVGSYVSESSFHANRADIDAGLAALDRARSSISAEDAPASAELDRLEAGLLSCRLTGLGTVLANKGKIQAALQRAFEEDPHSGHVHVALGCRLLFVPNWLGQDLEKAVEHFRFAAQAQPLNERPLVFAAFARYLQDKPRACLSFLRAAEDRNPQNPFIRAVLQRIANAEAAPFERDLQ